MESQQVRKIIFEEYNKLRKGIQRMKSAKSGLNEDIIPYNKQKMIALVKTDKVLKHLAKTKSANLEVLFYTYVLGDDYLTQQYNKL